MSTNSWLQAIALIALCLISATSFAQKHDNTWILGYPGNGAEYGHSVLTFTDGSLRIDSNSIMRDMAFPQNNSAYSLENGELFTFFNGLDIRNKTFIQDVENGGDIGELVDISTDYYLSHHFLPQGSLFIPFPGARDSILLIFQSRRYMVDDNGGVIDLFSPDMFAALINKASNGGLGSVVARYLPIIESDSLKAGALKAVKHANGRDWWILIHRWNSDQYHRILVDPLGIHHLGVENTSYPVWNGLPGSVFSPDGSKYVIYNTISANEGAYLDIFDFDRCTGLLSNQIQIKGRNGPGGVAISPNSRFLYNNKSDTAFQYNLQAADIPGSRKVVAVYDGFTDPFPVTFYMMQLAPDGKIYASATNGSRYLHVIHNPDEEGAACRYQQHGIQLYKYNDFSVPNFPNYRLGPLDGSPCDTLGLDNVPVAWYRHEQDTLDALSVAFTDLSYYEPATWRWDFGDGSPVVALRHPTHTFPGPDVYDVCLTVSNVYGTDTHCKKLYLGVSAVGNPVLQRSVVVSPNPVTDLLQIATQNFASEVLIQFLTPSGQIVWESVHPAGAHTSQKSVAHLPNGLYFYRVLHQGELTASGKFVIQH